MKYVFIFLLTGVLNLSCQNSASKDDKLKESIVTVIKAFKAKDAETLNKMIINDYGLTTIFRNGVFSEYKTTDNIDFNKPVPGHWPYPDFKPGFDIKYEALPVFDCESYKWSKQGLYCDLNEKSSLLSDTAFNLKEYAEVAIEPGIIEKFKDLESKSHRIVLIDDNGGELIFYLTLIKDKWYLTALDRVSSDCDS